MKAVRVAWEAAWPVLMFALFFAVLLVVADAPTPDDWHVPAPPPSPEMVNAAERGDLANAVGWEDIVIFSLAFAFLGTKSWVMLRRMGRPVDWLTVSLVMANGGFMSLFLLVVSRVFFSHWFLTHPDLTDALLRFLRWGLIISLAWGTIMVVMTPPGKGYYVVKDSEGRWTGDQLATQRMQRSRRRFRGTRRLPSAVKPAPSTTPPDHSADSY